MHARLVAAALVGTFPYDRIFSSKTCAINFGGDKSASYLAMVRELHVETHVIPEDLGKEDKA